jgi:hypothetical protein
MSEQLENYANETEVRRGDKFLENVGPLVLAGTATLGLIEALVSVKVGFQPGVIGAVFATVVESELIDGAHKRMTNARSNGTFL